jgi:N-acetylneuraminic acid mutarotase
VTIAPSGYSDYRTDIVIPAGHNQVVSLNAWVCPGASKQTATAWITFPADMNHGTVNDGKWNDTAQVLVSSGIPGWAQMTSLPATPSLKPIKDGAWLAYDAGTDAIYASKGNKTNDFYVFTLPAGTWTTLQSLPYGTEAKLTYAGATGCSDGNGNLFATKGNNTVGFWGYRESPTAAGEWTQLTNVPTGSSGKKVKAGAALAWATKPGVGSFAYLLKGYKNEFYRYDPATNTWTILLNAPIGLAGHVKYDVGSWMVSDNQPDAHMLYAFKGKYQELYSYDTQGDTWHALTGMPIQGTAGTKKAKTGSCAAMFTGKIYSLKGGNTTEFWRYFPLGDTWNAQFDIPLIGNSGQRKKVNGGGSMAGYPGTGVYAFKGNKTYEFWRYTPFEVLGAQPSRGGVMSSSTPMTNVSFAISPNPLLSGLATVRYNLPKAGLATLNVFDVTGRTVYEQTLAAGRNGTASLDLRKLDAGVYLVKVATEGFSTTQKLVVEH